MRRQLDVVTGGFTDAKAGYKAANRSSRYVRRRSDVPSMGAGHDWHIADESKYIYMGEAARSADRDDVLVGQALDRVVANEIQGGFTPNPDTGDTKLDRDLLQRWREESVDPQLCDPSGVMTFHDQERMVCRESKVVGDIFALPGKDGTVQLVEFHRCRSPYRNTKLNKRIVHGIEYAGADRLRRQRYWFTKVPKSIYDQVDKKDLTPINAFSPDGEPLVWHIFNQKRPSQSRGVTVFAPVFDMVTIHDDIQFATLIKQQLSAFFLLIRKRTAKHFADGPTTPKTGSRRADTDIGTEAIEEIAPGLEFKLGPEEDVTPWSPNIPSNETMQHVMMIERLISANLGAPLELVLLDGSQTNFSGWRGAMDQARMGFRANQGRQKRQFHRPYWRHKCHHWANSDPALARAREQSRKKNSSVNLYRHDWDVPGYPYIEPAKDATADVIRLANGMSSPRRIAGERGYDRGEIDREIVEDRANLIEAAAEAADQLNKKLKLEGGNAVTWRDLAPMPSAERVSVSMSGATGDAEQPGSTVTASKTDAA